MSVLDHPATPSRTYWRRWVQETSFLALGVLLAVAAFIVVLAGVTVGGATALLWVGLPLLSATGHAARWFADQERSSNDLLAGPLPEHGYQSARRWADRLADPQTWRDVLHAVAVFPLRLAACLIGVCWSVAAAGLTSFVLWGWALPRGEVSGLYGLLTGTNSALAETVVNTALGVLLLLTAPAVVHTMTRVRIGLAKALLSNPAAALRARAEAAEMSRAASARAEAHTLTMIERDLHDGPQQRLIRLTMDLEAARRRVGSDASSVAAYLDEAVLQSREVLQELRALSRGIAPPALREHGLVSATLTAAARNPVDTEVDTKLTSTTRFAADIEAAAYFVIAETLTNIAKHSAAQHAVVTLDQAAGDLIVRITDDGHGGAHLGKGHGLAGLHARLTALQGHLDVSSPAGGPTVISATIPAHPECVP